MRNFPSVCVIIDLNQLFDCDRRFGSCLDGNCDCANLSTEVMKSGLLLQFVPQIQSYFHKFQFLVCNFRIENTLAWLIFTSEPCGYTRFVCVCVHRSAVCGRDKYPPLFSGGECLPKWQDNNGSSFSVKPHFIRADASRVQSSLDQLSSQQEVNEALKSVWRCGHVSPPSAGFSWSAWPWWCICLHHKVNVFVGAACWNLLLNGVCSAVTMRWIPAFFTGLTPSMRTFVIRWYLQPSLLFNTDFNKTGWKQESWPLDIWDMRWTSTLACPTNSQLRSRSMIPDRLWD